MVVNFVMFVDKFSETLCDVMDAPPNGVTFAIIRLVRLIKGASHEH